MCLCSYARHEQMHQIIEELRAQTCKPKIFVWNNDPDYHFKDDRADWVINSTCNCHTRHVIMLWQMASTPYVARMDDDLHFADDRVLADVIPQLKKLKHRNQMIGAYGVRMYTGETYQDSHHIATPRGHGNVDMDKKPLRSLQNVEVDLLKGRILLAKQECSHGLTTGFGHYHTDLYLSMALAGRHRFFHVVTGHGFYDNSDRSDKEKPRARLLDFPVDDKGYCDRDDHYAKRDELCQTWAVNCLPSRKVRTKPTKEEKAEAPDS